MTRWFRRISSAHIIGAFGGVIGLLAVLAAIDLLTLNGVKICDGEMTVPCAQQWFDVIAILIGGMVLAAMASANRQHEISINQQAEQFERAHFLQASGSREELFVALSAIGSRIRTESSSLQNTAKHWGPSDTDQWRIYALISSEHEISQLMPHMRNLQKFDDGILWQALNNVEHMCEIIRLHAERPESVPEARAMGFAARLSTPLLIVDQAIDDIYRRFGLTGMQNYPGHRHHPR